MPHTLTLEAPEEVFTVLVKTAERTGQTPEALAACRYIRLGPHR